MDHVHCPYGKILTKKEAIRVLWFTARLLYHVIQCVISELHVPYASVFKMSQNLSYENEFVKLMWHFFIEWNSFWHNGKQQFGNGLLVWDVVYFYEKYG